MTVHEPTAYEVETFTGRYVDTKFPDHKTIHLEDIAHALSQTCRYGGHCSKYYSVAEHAVMCSIRVERKGGARDQQIAALHHDDAEAYLGDIPRPMKSLLGKSYVRLTDRMDVAIIKALGLEGQQADFHSKPVKLADNWALFVEAQHLLPSRGRLWHIANIDTTDQPKHVATPDYWRGGLEPAVAQSLYLLRDAALRGGQ